MDDDKEPKFWITVLKLVLGAIALIAFLAWGCISPPNTTLIRLKVPPRRLLGYQQ